MSRRAKRPGMLSARARRRTQNRLPHRMLENLSGAALPAGVTLAVILALTIPVPVPRVLVPDAVLMLVYTAAAFRAAVFPVWLCFLLGLLADLLGGTPPGMQAAAFIGAHAFASSQRQHLRLAHFLWGGFALVAAAVTAFRWAVLSGYHEAWLDAGPMVTNTALTVLIYPLVSHPLLRLVGGSRDAGWRA